MKKFKHLAFLSVLSVIGGVFAAEWSFASTSGIAKSEAQQITATIADAETIDLTDLGSWSVSSNNLALTFSNPDAENKGYKVTGTVTGSILFTFTIDSVQYAKETVNVIDVTAEMEPYSVTAGNVTATVTFDSSKCTFSKNTTEGTISLTVPSTALTAGECTGEFTKEADYQAFKTAVTATKLQISAIAKSAE